jgi:hypothetical protein
MNTELALTESWNICEKLAKSTIIPEAFRMRPENCYIALDIAQRSGVSPMVVMQNLHIIEGKPSWSSQYITATINASGRFDHLKFKTVTSEVEEEINYNEYKWVDKTRTAIPKSIKVKNVSVFAYTREKSSGEILEGPAVSIKMAIQEGWYFKNGSKWQTMTQIMLQYRAASFFGKMFCPELLMGLGSSDEVIETAGEKEINIPATTNTRTENVKAILESVVGDLEISVSLIDQFEMDAGKAGSLEELEEISSKYKGQFKGEEAKKAKEIYKRVGEKFETQTE